MQARAPVCCLIAIAAFLGPRIAGVVWWLLDPSRWNAAFGSLLWPVLGLIFLPWTTLVWVLFAPLGLGPVAIVALVLALVVDLASYGGGYRTRRSGR